MVDFDNRKSFIGFRTKKILYSQSHTYVDYCYILFYDIKGKVSKSLKYMKI